MRCEEQFLSNFNPFNRDKMVEWLCFYFKKVEKIKISSSIKTCWDLYKVDDDIAYVYPPFVMLSPGSGSMLLNEVFEYPTTNCWRGSKINLEECGHFITTTLMIRFLHVSSKGKTRTETKLITDVAVEPEFLGKEVPLSDLYFTTYSKFERPILCSLVGVPLKFGNYVDQDGDEYPFKLTKVRWNRYPLTHTYVHKPSNLKTLYEQVTEF